MPDVSRGGVAGKKITGNVLPENQVNVEAESGAFKPVEQHHRRPVAKLDKEEGSR